MYLSASIPSEESSIFLFTNKQSTSRQSIPQSFPFPNTVTWAAASTFALESVTVTILRLSQRQEIRKERQQRTDPGHPTAGARTRKQEKARTAREGQIAAQVNPIRVPIFSKSSPGPINLPRQPCPAIALYTHRRGSISSNRPVIAPDNIPISVWVATLAAYHE